MGTIAQQTLPPPVLTLQSPVAWPNTQQFSHNNYTVYPTFLSRLLYTPVGSTFTAFKSQARLFYYCCVFLRTERHMPMPCLRFACLIPSLCAVRRCCCLRSLYLCDRFERKQGTTRDTKHKKYISNQEYSENLLRIRRRILQSVRII